MPVNVTSSLPRTNFRGIRDESPVNLAMPVESLPIRLPLFMSFAPWGEENVGRYVDQDALHLLYGADVTNPKTKFFTHQSQFIRSQFTGGGKCMFLRVTPSDVAQANFRLALDMVADDIPVYERNPDGSFLLNASGEKIDTGTTVPGYRLQWRLVAIPVVSTVLNFGLGAPMEGAMVAASDGATSTLTPIIDGLARFRGKKGSNIGFRLIAPTTASTEAADPELQERLAAFVYRMQIVERSSASSTSTVKRTLTGSSYVDFSVKQDTIDLETDIQYSIDRAIKPAYESTDPTAFTGFGPFERLHVYNSSIQSILQTLADAEELVTSDEIADPNLINFLTGVDVNGIPYHSFVVEGPAQGGLLFSEMTNHYMLGGSDGTLTTANYNDAVEAVLDSLSTSVIPFRSIARMPYDSVWDSGFPVDVKKKFANFHNLRPDVYIHACTQDVTQPLNTPAEDSSIGVTLRSHFRAMQESSEFGTKALRFAVFENAGYLISDDYTGLVPFLEYLCLMGARYMGAENGEMNADFTFGRGEENVITRYRDHNVGDKSVETLNTDWQNGLNFAEWYDMSRLFWPSLQSIYETQTSSLHSYLNVQIACNLTRIGHIVWRELAGDSKLTDDEFLDEVAARVVAKTTGKYDDRADITPNAYYTALDDRLTFSYHLDIGMATDNGRSVQNLAIISQNRRTSEVS